MIDNPYDFCPDESNESIVALLDGLSLYGFYRALYRATECGITVGFKINGEWVYCDELPRKTALEVSVTGVGLSSIVEGSDAEVSWRELPEEFTTKAFYAEVEEVNDEACRLWDEANGESEESEAR